MIFNRVLCILVCLFHQSYAANSTFLPPPQDVTLIQSRNYPEVSISYKETSICETTPGVKGYSGFITIPSFDKTYNASIFFWYFQARTNTANAPTTIYLPGGPGTSFLDGASGFPCVVNDDSNSTNLNPWSWNNDANMLYLDVPVQTGYSYTNPWNGTLELVTTEFASVAKGVESVATNLTTVAATMSSQDPAQTVNTTSQVAEQTWRIAQVWFQEFTEFKTKNEVINLWSYSYSGFFGPATLAYFQRQNEKIADGSIKDPHAKALRLGTLGINNGCIDTLVQAASYPEFAFNNTYGIQAISPDLYQVAKANLTKPNGCFDLINQCRAMVKAKDPEGTGSNTDVNQACRIASNACFVEVQGAYQRSTTRSPFDITHEGKSIVPPDYSASFFNKRWVQEALGTPVNFTLTLNVIVENLFFATGDPMIRTITDLEYLLSSGVGLAMVYGDRDYRCNWIGAENVSLTMSYPGASTFRAAGYTDLITNSSYKGGLVRQSGNVSFSRVFQAGHSVAAYQPETVYRIFHRAIKGRDVATGDVAATSAYGTSGPANVFGVKNVAPPSPPSICFYYEPQVSCTDEQLAALENGTAVVHNDVVVSPPGFGLGGTGSSSNSGGSPSGSGTPPAENPPAQSTKASGGAKELHVSIDRIAMPFAFVALACLMGAL